MDTVFAFFLSLLVVSVSCDHITPLWCVSNDTKADCEKIEPNITCFVSSDCVGDVVSGKADVVVVDAKAMVAHVDHLEIVFVEKYTGVAATVRYYGVAVVKKNSTLALNNLKGKKSCHTAAGRNAGWVIPIGYLLAKKSMPYVDNPYKSAADYFGGSCVPGVKEKVKNSKTVTDKLCELCKNPTSCSKENDEYAGYEGAFLCMADGAGEVAFVKHTTPGDATSKNATKYGVASDYKLLCQNGEKKDISEFANCNVARRPASAVVVATKNKEHIGHYRSIIKALNLTKLITAKLLDKNTEKLEPYDKGTSMYLGDYYNDLKALNPDNKAGSVAVSLVLQVLGILTVLLVF